MPALNRGTSQCSIATSATAVASEKKVKIAPVSVSAVRARAWACILERMIVSCLPLEIWGSVVRRQRSGYCPLGKLRLVLWSNGLYGTDRVKVST